MNMRTKTLFVTLLGNTLEFYDLGLYGFLAPQIASYYFPVDNQFVLLIASMGIFAAGFIMRPFGALIFGYIGDFLGRKISLSHTILLMAFPTFIIGILPTYEKIGILAPLLLIMCRLLQGICTGGEYNNAAIFLLEHTKSNKRSLYSGLMTASSILGFFLASSMAVIVSFSSVPITWGWRIPFLFGALIGIVGFYFRRSHILESPAFQKQEKSFLIWSDLKQHSKSLFFTMGIGWLAGTLSLTLIGYIPSYLSVVAKLSNQQTALISNLGIFVYMIFLPIMGGIADKMGAQNIMKIASMLTLLTSYSLFSLLGSGVLSLTISGEILLAILAAGFLGPMHAYMLNLFPPQFRCRGISVAFALGVGLLGGTAPLVSTFLIRHLEFKEAPALYFALSAVAGILSTRINSLALDSHHPDTLASVQT